MYRQRQHLARVPRARSSRSLLTRSRGEMVEMGCSFSLLYTGIESFYHALGWRAVKRKTLFGAPASQASPIAPNTPPADISQLRSLYDSAYASSPLTQIRSEIHWAKKTAPDLRNNLFFQTPDAYLAAKEEDGRLVVLESGYAQAPQGEDILERVIAWAGAQGLKEIEFRVPISPLCDKVATKALSGRHWVEGSDGMAGELTEAWPLDSVLEACARPDARFLSLDNF